MVISIKVQYLSSRLSTDNDTNVECTAGTYAPRSLNSVRCSKAKYVVWTPDSSKVAVLGKHSEWLACGRVSSILAQLR